MHNIQGRHGRHSISRYCEELGQCYLALGRELLPYTHQALDEETLTLEFIQQWGKIMFCHRLIAS
jgi:hypothetical protein